MKALIITIFLAFVLQAQPTPRYVAPYGSGGACTAESPCTLASQLQAGAAPGEVWLLPGMYTGDFQARAPGVTYRSVPGTRAVIDGSLDIWADDTTWEGLEVTYSGWQTRVSSTPGEAPPPGIAAHDGVSIFGARTRIIDCIIHDARGNGIGWWKTAEGSSVERCLVYNNGWQGPDRGHGHGVYAQNGGAVRPWRDFVTINNYATNGKIYTATDAPIANFDVDHLISIGNEIRVGGNKGPAAGISLRNSLLWQSRLIAHDVYTSNVDIELLDSTVVVTNGTPLFVKYWHDLNVQRNTIVGGGGDIYQVNADMLRYAYPEDTYTATGIWDNNAYFYNNTWSKVFRVEQSRGQAPGGLYAFANWQAVTGYDTHSTFVRGLPSVNRIDVRPWGPHRGAVSVLNWSGAPTVTLDLSALDLTAGASYKLTNAQNRAEALAFVAGSPVSLPTLGWTVAAPVGAGARAWDSRFSVWLVEPV